MLTCTLGVGNLGCDSIMQYTLLECVIKGLNSRLTDIITLQVCGGAPEQEMGRTPKDEPGKEEEKMENVEY